MWFCTRCKGEVKTNVTKIKKLEKQNLELKKQNKEIEERLNNMKTGDLRDKWTK